MKQINIWELDTRISVKINKDFLKKLKTNLFRTYRTKRNCYHYISHEIGIAFDTFKNILKENYHETVYFSPLEIWISLCKRLGISLDELQKNIVAYKTSNGPNYIIKPILPIKITPIFDMLIAHNIADGTVINPKKGRLPYFGYRQFDPFFRELYIKKLEAIFGKINFQSTYYVTSTRPYCPPVLASLFFKFYNLNVRSFLSKSARIPYEIINKNRKYLLAVLLAFVIDEGNIDSTLIVIGLKNPKLANDLYVVCQRLNYKCTLKIRGEYGYLYILRDGMKQFFIDYQELVKEYPEVNLGKIADKIKQGLKIYERPLYKTKGNRDSIIAMLKLENLTVNQIANRINMTRQGVRYHINGLEKLGEIKKKWFFGERNIVYGVEI